MSRRNLKI